MGATRHQRVGPFVIHIQPRVIYKQQSHNRVLPVSRVQMHRFMSILVFFVFVSVMDPRSSWGPAK